MNARHITIIAKKEFQGLNHEKTILLAVLLQLFVAMFSSFLMVGLTSMYDPSSLSAATRVRYGIALVGANTTLDRYLGERADFQVYRMDLSTGIAALEERKLAAVIYVPPTPPDAREPVQVTLYTLQNDIQTAVVQVKLKEVLLEYEEDLREERRPRLSSTPLDVRFPAGQKTEGFYEFVYGLLIPLLVFMPAIIASSLIIDMITEEYQHNTLETLVSTPVSFAEVVWGKVLACELLVPVQAGAWLLLLAINGIRVENPLPVLFLVSLSSLALILLSALTALHYRERTAAQFIYSTALVVVILVVIAIPGNPLNVIVRAVTGSPGMDLAGTLAIVGIGAMALGYVTHRYAERIGRLAQLGT
ncbi:MAG: ABC transporter permease [Methanomicrobiales archaeon]|nr:ABC transporter permease [Methanomicrobiales archaeon]